jgi:hypothetical protein
MAVSFIGLRKPEKTTDLPQVTGNFIKYISSSTAFEFTTLVVIYIGTD